MSDLNFEDTKKKKNQHRYDVTINTRQISTSVSGASLCNHGAAFHMNRHGRVANTKGSSSIINTVQLSIHRIIATGFVPASRIPFIHACPVLITIVQRLSKISYHLIIPLTSGLSDGRYSSVSDPPLITLIVLLVVVLTCPSTDDPTTTELRSLIESSRAL